MEKFIFEYVPKTQILEKNLSLNQGLKNRIKVIPHPVWESSDVSFAVEDNGPACKISLNDLSSAEQTVTTLSIDDLVESQEVNCRLYQDGYRRCRIICVEGPNDLKNLNRASNFGLSFFEENTPPFFFGLLT